MRAAVLDSYRAPLAVRACPDPAPTDAAFRETTRQSRAQHAIGRRVESALRFPRDARRFAQQVVQAAFHWDGGGKGGAVEAADFAVIAVDGELIFEFVEDVGAVRNGEGGFAEDHEYFGELANI